jgi:hypothetical protein
VKKRTNRQAVVSPVAETDSAPSETPAALRSVTRWLKGLTILVIAAWGLLAIQILLRDNGDTAASRADSHSTASGPSAPWTGGTSDHAPWGRLTYLPITIAPPLEMTPRAAPSTPEDVQWHFPKIVPERLPALLAEIGLSESLREKLLPLAEMNPGIEGLTIRPTREIVLGLSPEDRSALYVTLAGFRENLDQRNAFRFCGDSLDEWLEHSPLSPETRTLIEPLIYRHGSLMFFADLRSIEESWPSPEERAGLIKALSRESTFQVRLEYSPEVSLRELVEYWGRGGRTREVLPILESLYQAHGERSIDITLLLPPFARSRLYTYQVFFEVKPGCYRDCHWAAMNFFSDQPDDRYADAKEVSRARKEDHYRIYGNPRLGDLVVFVEDRTTQIHSEAIRKVILL